MIEKNANVNKEHATPAIHAEKSRPPVIAIPRPTAKHVPSAMMLEMAKYRPWLRPDRILVPQL